MFKNDFTLKGLISSAIAVGDGEGRRTALGIYSDKYEIIWAFNLSI